MDRIAPFLTKLTFLLEFVTTGGGTRALMCTDLMLERIKDIVKIR